MGRPYRWFNDEEYSSYHIISRVSRGNFLLGKEEKEHFMNLMFRLSELYYVNIISFAIMSNHFHILLSVRENEAKKATWQEMLKRYRAYYGESSYPPEGSYIKASYEIDYDEDGGEERLRYRLGSISRYVQDLKQEFTRWYNYKNKVKGYFWGDRFKGIAISKGEAELVCSAYIDLNSIRAGIVKKPEDYRWSSIGMRVRNPRKAKKLLTDIILIKSNEKVFTDKESGKRRVEYETEKKRISFPVYIGFVYDSGRVDKEGRAKISDKIYKESKSLLKRLGIGDKLKYRYRNITEGIAFGSYKFIAELQEVFSRKYIKPRGVIRNEEKEAVFYSTRDLKRT